MAISNEDPWTFAFGVLGNLVSFMVYLSPVPTFYQICKKKTSEGFQSVPYVVALFSAMLWIYYALIKTNSSLLIIINTIGCVIETIYIIIYFCYAPKKDRIYTAKLFFSLNVGLFCLILLLTLVLAKGANRVQVLGWICVAFSVIVYVAPLSIMRLVIRTKSVEYMPFSLSFFLTVSAVIWFFYGLLLKDLYVTLPNVLGFIFGVLQMVLYLIYMNAKKDIREEKLPEHTGNAVRLSAIRGSEVHPIEHERSMGGDNRVHEPTNRSEEDMGSEIEV